MNNSLHREFVRPRIILPSAVVRHIRIRHRARDFSRHGIYRQIHDTWFRDFRLRWKALFVFMEASPKEEGDGSDEDDEQWDADAETDSKGVAAGPPARWIMSWRWRGGGGGACSGC